MIAPIFLASELTYNLRSDPLATPLSDPLSDPGASVSDLCSDCVSTAGILSGAGMGCQ